MSIPYALPSEASDFLTRLIKKRIVRVKRQLYMPDKYRNDYEQAADGPVELQLDDGYVIHFVAWAERESVGVVEGEMLRYGADAYELRDLTINHFWHNRVNQIIERIDVFKSMDPVFDGECIEIQFRNGLKACIEYLDEEDFMDMVRVTDKHTKEAKSCLKLTK